MTLREPDVYPVRNESYNNLYIDRVEYRFTSPPGSNLFMQLINFRATNNTDLAIYSGIFAGAGHNSTLPEENRAVYHPGIGLVDSISGSLDFSILSNLGYVVITQPIGEDVNLTLRVSVYGGENRHTPETTKKNRF